MNERVKKFVTNPVYICLVILSASVIGLCIAVGLHNNSRKSTESDLEEAVSVLQNSDLNTITGGVLYLQDRGDGIKDLVVTSNLQMIGSNDNGVTYKTGRIVFNHMEDDIHLDKAKAMIARVPHDSGHSDTYQYEPIVMTVKNEADANMLVWAELTTNSNETATNALRNTNNYIRGLGDTKDHNNHELKLLT